MTDKAETKGLTTEAKLVNLGDPSGRQDASYWDSWFTIVCEEQNNRPFEWYCSSEEVQRMIKHYEVAENNDETTTATVDGGVDRPSVSFKRMIHPGSGTSLLPLQLRKSYPKYEQWVVDVSPTAIRQMVQVHGQQQAFVDLSAPDPPLPLQYQVTDLLSPPLPFEKDFFNCWIDKGFVDAVFSRGGNPEDSSDQSKQSSALFAEANRILLPGCGMIMIISLAEAHSLRVIWENLQLAEWNSIYHVWELTPVSGELRPFGFVATKSDVLDSPSDRTIQIVWHGIGGDTKTHEIPTPASLIPILYDLVEESRQEYKRSLTKSRQESERRLLLVLEIKPIDSDVDLHDVAKRVREESKTVGGALSSFNLVIEESKSSFYEIVPIGFGISKLRLRLILLQDDVESLEETMLDTFEDLVQSVDVLWDESIPVSSTDTLF